MIDEIMALGWEFDGVHYTYSLPYTVYTLAPFYSKKTGSYAFWLFEKDSVVIGKNSEIGQEDVGKAKEWATNVISLLEVSN